MKKRLFKGLLLLISLVLAVILLPTANAQADDSDRPPVTTHLTFYFSENSPTHSPESIFGFDISVPMPITFHDTIATYTDFIDYYSANAQADYYTYYPGLFMNKILHTNRPVRIAFFQFGLAYLTDNVEF